MRRRYSPEEIEIHLLDGIARSGADFQKKVVEDGYRACTSSIPLIWPFLYQVSNLPFIMDMYSKSMSFYSAPLIRKYIRKHGITRIVNLHFLLNRSLMKALRQLKMLEIPVTTIVTDPFTIHRMWFYWQFSSVIVFSRRACKDAKKYLRWLGIPVSFLGRPRKIDLFPPILSPRFNQPLALEKRRELRETYGFSREKRLILMAGGGEGLPKGEKYLEAIVREELDAQIAFVCGRNISQFQRISTLAAKYPHAPIKVYGFVDFMYELMNMADVIVTKAGPATIFESLLLQKPLILTQRLYGQEQGNVDFVVNNGLGWFISKPRAMMEKIEEILDKPEIFQRTIANIKKARIQNGTEAIVEHLMNQPREPEKVNRLLQLYYSTTDSLTKFARENTGKK